jgi:hypothetical protein
MTMTIFPRAVRTAGAMALAAATLMAAPAHAEFRGGGALHNFVGCEAQGWYGTNAVRVRYRPGELLGNPTAISFFLPDGGALTMRTYREFVDRSNWFLGRGDAIWDQFYNWGTRPRMRILRRIVNEPSGAGFVDATEITIRMRIQNFNGLAGCTADASMILHRTPPAG